MSYAEIRGKIGDGDLVAVRSARSLLGKATLLAAGPYTHTAIALWLEGGLWVTEMDGVQNVLVPLSQYADASFDVFICQVDRARVRQVILEELRGKVGYSWADVARLVAYFTLGVPLPASEPGMQICSSQSAWIWATAGWPGAAKLPSIPWPSALVRALEAAPALRHEPDQASVVAL